MRFVAIIVMLSGLALMAERPASGQTLDLPPGDLGAWRDTLSLGEGQPYALRPFVIPGSETLLFEGAPVDTARYRIDHRYGRLWVDPLSARSDAQVVAVYRTYPLGLSDAVRRRGVQTMAPDSTGAVAVVEETGGEPFDPFGGVQLQRSGSITRGISAGNTRDVAVESGLRLQLAGEVAPDVTVQAVLTDENTPILPEGTTQRLSEFDRVFIEVAAPRATAQLGDVDLRLVDSEFARFTRKLQGVTTVATLPDASGGIVGPGQVTAAAATARGTFRTQDLVPQEGVQGPYRLEGLNGEQFIIVVPGSEAVYLNGALLTRGEANDYVIDYATGELTFTARRLITAETRLTVEFQYATGQFTRTLVATEAQAGFWQRPDGRSRARLGVSFLREADSRQLDEEFGLTPADSLLLALAGDNRAARDGGERVAFDPEAPFVQYTQEVVGVDTIYVPLEAAPPPGTPVFRVRFTRVGEGQGRYARVGRAVNGIRYEYRGPGGGAYEALRILPRPEQQRLLDVRGSLALVPGVEVFGEWAGSTRDQNRFSDLDDGDNRAGAYVGGLRLAETPVTLFDRQLGRVAAQLRRRNVQSGFAAFDRTRPVEFARRWNLGLAGLASAAGTEQPFDETIDEANVAVAFTDRSRLGVEAGRIRLGEAFRGSRQAVALALGEPGVPRLAYDTEWIQSTDSLRRGLTQPNNAPGEAGRWLRQRGRVEQPLVGSRLVPVVEVEHENRRQRVLGTDSLTTGTLAFVAVRPGLAWTTEDVELAGFVERRDEQRALAGDLEDAATAWTAETRFRLRPSAQLRTEGSVGYRVRRAAPAFAARQQEEDSESIVTSWTGTFTPSARAVDVNWFYEALSERTPTLQEIYVRTGPELGQYVWVDGSNGSVPDGIIQLDELLPERTPDEGLYVRTFLPSDSLQAIISVQARLRVQLDPGRQWQDAAARWKRLLSHVTTRTTLEVNEKSRDPDLAQIYFLNLGRYRSPETTLNGRLRIGQDVTLFRRSSRYGLDLSFGQIRALSELAAGEETRFVNTWRLSATYRPSTRVGTRLEAARETNRTVSEAFATRTFAIESLSLTPEVTVNVLRSLQLALSAGLANKTDAVEDRTARLLKVPLEVRFSQVRRLQLTGRLEVANVRLGGEAAGLAQFELTDGRGPGTSYLWSVDGQYRLSRLLRATLAYNGRAPADAPVLHTVRVQLSATF